MRKYAIPVVLALVLAATFLLRGNEADPPVISESVFKQNIVKKEYPEVLIKGDEIIGLSKEGKQIAKAHLHLPDESLIPFLDKSGVTYKAEGTFWNTDVMHSIVSVLIVICYIVILFYMKKTGKSKHKTFSAQDCSITFDDVAGCEEAKVELKEILEYFKNPEQATRLGGKVSKGVLLYGPPGTGKTLLAKATAGEAKIPFLHLSGSDFVEMYVGVGAARVRDLFKQARGLGRCIIFIDEIDSLGRARTGGGDGGTQEGENALNQLLTELDGFNQGNEVVVMAATNRRDVLDKALLRPGRFDRHIRVDLPDMHGREEILKVHAAKVKFAEGIDLHEIAKQTHGFSGADLANLVNESAIIAQRDLDTDAIYAKHLQQAFLRVIGGLERKTRRLNETERKTVAYHEAGHAIVGAVLQGVESVQKVSIVPRGEALGLTIRIPAEDRFLSFPEEVLGRIAMLLGGREAEKLIFRKYSSGAADDLAQATIAARRYITQFAFGGELQHCSFEQFNSDGELVQVVPASQETLSRIDREVLKLLSEQSEKAINILSCNMAGLHALSEALLEHETLTGPELKSLLAGVRREDGEVAAPVTLRDQTLALTS